MGKKGTVISQISTLKVSSHIHFERFRLSPIPYVLSNIINRCLKKSYHPFRTLDFQFQVQI